MGCYQKMTPPATASHITGLNEKTTARAISIVAVSAGAASIPFTDDVIDGKILDCAARSFSLDDAYKVIESLRDFDRIEDVRSIFEFPRKANTGS